MKRSVESHNKAGRAPWIHGKAASSAHVGGIRRVLLAEDNPVNQLVAVGMLEGAGCEVIVAANGVEAVAQATSQQFDVILMDCMMPELDGYGATAAIRAHEASTDLRTPIVALTASALSGEREQCLAAGMDDYLPKPMRKDDLLAMLDRWSGVGAVPRAEAGAMFTAELAEDTPPAFALDQRALDNILECPGGRGSWRRRWPPIAMPPRSRCHACASRSRATIVRPCSVRRTRSSRAARCSA